MSINLNFNNVNFKNKDSYYFIILLFYYLILNIFIK